MSLSLGEPIDARQIKKKAIRCQILLNTKWKSDLTIDKLKARCVAMGNYQKYNDDYFASSAPVCNLSSVRLLSAIAVRSDQSQAR